VNSETWTVGHVGPTYEELATNPPPSWAVATAGFRYHMWLTWPP